MEVFILLFPILFIFHDMEEIIGLKPWLNANKKLIEEKYPFVNKMCKDYSTEGMALAVFEELVLCLIVCALAFCFKNAYVWGIWFGAFIAYTIHLVIHLVQSVIFRKYIPALITSIICLPFSVFVIYKTNSFIDLSVWVKIGFVAIGIFIVAANLKFAQSLIGKFKRWMEK